MTFSRKVMQRIIALETQMNGIPQVDCPVKHYFAPGVFAREITIPAGTVLVGAVHKTDNIAVLSAGRVKLATEDGHIEVSAPYTHFCKAGAKNAFVAITTAVWTNFLSNPDNETDTDLLVERYTESKAVELLGGGKNIQLAANKVAESIEA